ncbi:MULTISPECIES: substrate-binding periplasmic protein [unclassified Pseudoalteromonas]|uniref:substrate-binding periplasmic protein n=1 Tax=unclassified Pseudoalteromonas TaxID=194690 RepID=UPI0030151BD4
MRSFLFIILLLAANVTTAENLNVAYYKQGEFNLVQGERYQGGYLYNKNGKKPRVHLVTLDWPPYIGEALCNKGWAFQFAVAILTDLDYQVFVQFLPWARAVRAVETGKADILFPEYYIEDSAPSDNHKNKTRRELLALSNAFPGGEIGFLKRRGETDRFDGNLSSVQNEVIGVVRGYQNTPEFDAMMDNGEFVIVEAVDDLQLVKLLAGKRVNLVIGDPKVLKFTVNYSDLPRAQKIDLLRSVERVKPAIKYNHLYFALSKKKPHWRALLKDINMNLYKFENSGETQRMIEMGSSECF